MISKKSLGLVGLTQREAQIYVFLKLKGPNKLCEIRRGLRIGDTMLTRYLRQLEMKRAVVATQTTRRPKSPEIEKWKLGKVRDYASRMGFKVTIAGYAAGRRTYKANGLQELAKKKIGQLKREISQLEELTEM